MHFDQQTMTRIRETAMNLERVRKQLDAAEKAGMDFEHVKRLRDEFDVAQEAMVNVGINATATLPRAVKQDVAA